MTTQLERELTDLFRDVAAHIEVQPAPLRRRPHPALSRAIVAGLTAAVVAAVALVATRLDGGATRGAPASPGSTQRLVDAVARTTAQPLRIHTTFAPAGAPAEDAITEVDSARGLLETWRHGKPQLLVVDKRMYVAIPLAAPTAAGLPAGAQWQELPKEAVVARSTLMSAAGVIELAPLQRALSAHQVDVQTDGPDRYHLVVQPPRASGSSAAATGGSEELWFHITPDGYVDQVRAEISLTDGPVQTIAVRSDLVVLHRPVRVHPPDPKSVVSEQQLMASQGGSSEQCTHVSVPPPTASGDSNEIAGETVTCSDTATAVATPPAGKSHQRR